MAITFIVIYPFVVFVKKKINFWRFFFDFFNMNTNGMIFVKRMDKLLSNRNETRVDLSKNVNVTTQTISHWSTRGTIPAADIALKIADYLNVSLEYLLYGTEKTFSNDELNLISRYRDFTPEQKTTVKAVFDSFEKQNSEKNKNVV